MSFLTPTAALIAAAVTLPLLLSLYFLKLRRRRVRVSSTLLWKQAVQDMEVNTPWQKLRNNLLLWLQLLLFAALLFAMARPVSDEVAREGQRVVIVIDHSGSMRTADADGGDATRLADAKRRALELLAGLDGSPVMVIAFAERAQVLTDFTTDRGAARVAIEQLAETDQRSNLEAALALIEPEGQAVEASGGDALRVVVFSDGRVHRFGDGPMALPGSELVYEACGAVVPDASVDRTNVGIVAFSARRDLVSPDRVQVYARVVNYTPGPVEATATLTLDGNAVRTRRMRLPAAPPVSVDEGTGREVFAEPKGEELALEFTHAGGGLVRLALGPEDQMAADNDARLVLAPARRLRVLLVGERADSPIESAIRAYGVAALDEVTGNGYASRDAGTLVRAAWDGEDADTGYDLIVFDGVSPEAVPPVDALYFAAAPPVEGLRRLPASEEDNRLYGVLQQHPDHPLMRYVVLDEVLFWRPDRLVVPSDGTILATAERGPLLAEVVRDGVRHVVAGTAVAELNEPWQWQHALGFVVFMHNVMDTLGLGQLADAAGVQYAAGAVAALPEAQAAERYQGPETVTPRRVGGRAVLPAFRLAGLYNAATPTDPPYDQLAVNLLDEVESDARVASVLEVGAAPVRASGTGGETTGGREVWPWFVWGALALLLVEWFAYTWRMRV